MLVKDHVISNTMISIANEKGISVASVEEVLDKYYKAVGKAKEQGVLKVKLDHLGSFALKGMYKELNGNNGKKVIKEEEC